MSTKQCWQVIIITKLISENKHSYVNAATNIGLETRWILPVNSEVVLGNVVDTFNPLRGDCKPYPHNVKLVNF